MTTSFKDPLKVIGKNMHNLFNVSGENVNPEKFDEIKRRIYESYLVSDMENQSLGKQIRILTNNNNVDKNYELGI